MMDTLRSYAKGWASQLLLVVLVLSFAVWGVSDFFTGFQQNTVATVGSTDISAQDFQRTYDQEVRRLQQQLGTPISQEMARQLGVPQQVLARLVSQATLQEAASDLGLGLSDQALAERIANDPRYQGSNGTFDRGLLTQIIAGMGMTEDQFIVQARNEYTRGQLGDALASGVSTPQSYLRAMQQFRDERRTLSYVVLAAPPASEIADPDETTLTAYFEANKARWNAPELRSLIYATLSPEAIARPADVSDADAQARYDANSGRFSTVERRQIQQILFPSRVEAEAAAAALSSGKIFDDIIAERGLKLEDVDLGMLTREQVIDAAIREAAFALQANATSPIVDTAFGPVILRVTTIEPAVVTSFDSVKDQLKTEIANERAATEINEMHDAVEDARAGGDSLANVAERYGLTVVAVSDVDATGNDATGTPVAGLPRPVVTAAFQTEVGFPNAPVEPSRGTYVWYDVTAITAPRERPLAEVRDAVVAAWKDAERQRLVDARAADAKAALDGGGNLAEIAAQNGTPVLTTTGITRATAPTGALSSAAIATAFDAREGTAVTAAGTDPLTALVLKVDSITVPPFDANAPEVASISAQLDPQFLSDLLGLYIGELQKKTDLRINEAVLQQLLGLTTVN